MRLVHAILIAVIAAPLGGCGILDSDSDDDRDERRGDRRNRGNTRLEERRGDRLGTQSGRYSRNDLVLLGSVRTRGTEEANDVLEVKGGQRFKGLLFEVDQGEVAIEHIRVTFADDTSHEPETQTRFRAGEQTRLIDLPGNNQDVKRVRVRYRSIGGQQSTIDVLGLPIGR